MDQFYVMVMRTEEFQAPKSLLWNNLHSENVRATMLTVECKGTQNLQWKDLQTNTGVLELRWQMDKKRELLSLDSTKKKYIYKSSSTNWEMSEQVTCKDKSKFSGTFYVRHTCRDKKTHINTVRYGLESKSCVAKTNFS